MKHLPEHVQKHIQTIAQQEQAFQSRQTAIEKIGHAVSGFVGSFAFILLHVVWFSLWLLLNIIPHRWFPPFDHSPFLYSPSSLNSKVFSW